MQWKFLAPFQVSPLSSFGENKSYRNLKYLSLTSFAIITPGTILNISSVQFYNKITFRNLRYLFSQFRNKNLLSQFSYGTYVKFRTSALTTQ